MTNLKLKFIYFLKCCIILVFWRLLGALLCSFFVSTRFQVMLKSCNYNINTVTNLIVIVIIDASQSIAHLRIFSHHSIISSRLLINTLATCVNSWILFKNKSVTEMPEIVYIDKKNKKIIFIDSNLYLSQIKKPRKTVTKNPEENGIKSNSNSMDFFGSILPML